MEIYLSKSNLANQDDIIYLNNLLGDIDGIKLTGWVSASGDADKLKRAGILIIIPPAGNTNEDKTHVGKGNSDQYDVFRTWDSGKPVFVFRDKLFFEIKNRQLVSEKIREWKNNYSILIHHDIPPVSYFDTDHNGDEIVDEDVYDQLEERWTKLNTLPPLSSRIYSSEVKPHTEIPLLAVIGYKKRQEK